VQKPSLKAIARTPVFPNSQSGQSAGRDKTVKNWAGAQVRNIADEGEMSAYGLPGVTGILVVKLDPKGPLAKAGLEVGDVILGFDDDAITQVSDILNPKHNATAGTSFSLKISRNQQIRTLNVIP
jgi:serine protease Do